MIVPRKILVPVFVIVVAPLLLGLEKLRELLPGHLMALVVREGANVTKVAAPGLSRDGAGRARGERAKPALPATNLVKLERIRRRRGRVEPDVRDDGVSASAYMRRHVRR